MHRAAVRAMVRFARGRASLHDVRTRGVRGLAGESGAAARLDVPDMAARQPAHRPSALPGADAPAASRSVVAGTPLLRGAPTGAYMETLPCADARAVADAAEGRGPEPQYDRVVTGYKLFRSREPFTCEWGGVLPETEVAYETWGELNEHRDNAILLHTGLSASSHARSHDANRMPGWWEHFIGPGRALDTDHFFVICANVLGGCYGSTGPSSIHPQTGMPYAMSFPIITVGDMVRAQMRLLDALGIERLHASIGASLGGMQSLALASMYPQRTGRVVSISAAARSHPLSIALRYLQRRALMSDPHWNGGFYYGGRFPYNGMRLAREVATVSYRSGPEWELRFGTRRMSDGLPSFCPDFLIESYLDHQSEQFSLKYDPNSLLYISKAMDMFDLSKGRMSLEDAFRAFHGPTLVLGVKSDMLFPVWQQAEVAAALRRAGNDRTSYYELDSLYGHDTFLIEINSVGSAVKGHLENGVRFPRLEPAK